MKYFNTIAIAVLFIAMGILFYLHFKPSEKIQDHDFSAGLSGKKEIFFVNIDTLLPKLDMYKDVQSGLAKKQVDMESNFAAKYKTFERNVSDFQKRLSDPTEIVTQVQREQIDQQLSKQRMDLENLQSSYMNQLQQEGVTANRKIIEFIMEYLKDYSKDKGIQYILSYGFGGNLLYYNSSLDITNEILYGLNEKYLKEKTMKK